MEATASVIAVVELAAKIASLCVEYSSAVKNARSDIERLRKHTISLKITVDGAQQLLQGPDGARLQTSQKLRESLEKTHSQLGDVATKLEAKLHTGRRAKAMRRVGLRALKWPFESRDVDKIIANLQREQDSFSAALQIDQTAEILDIHCKIDLTTLPVASGAAFDSHAEEHNARCHSDTRTELLRQIREWANDAQAESIFWLNGVAGTGKSTISRTVADSFAADGLLGASFFFKRGEGDRGKADLVFPTIASQLVRNIPALVPSVRKAIDADPEVPKKALRDQFEKLILQPLGCIHRTTAVVIIIDALDECDGDKDVKTIISLLAQANVVRSVRLRIFITSRPELPIRLGFKNVQGKYQGIALHQIPEPVVEQDISTFLGDELARIRDEYNGQALKCFQLPLGWPGEDVIRTLAQMAVPLFIFAATVCRFVEDKAWSNPGDQLKKVLKYQVKTFDSELDKLDATYLPILDQLITGHTDLQRSRILTEFRDAVGPIVLLAQPLSVSSLARLLNIPAAAIYGKLNSLHSVLDIPSEDDVPVRLFHLSFRDFLVDPTKRTKEFWIDETKYHRMLVDRCIQLMCQHLKRDVCSLQLPGKLRSEVDQRTIDAALLPEVQYACQYWVHHLKECKGSVRDGGPVHSFLKSHLLYWLEALGLIGRVSESISMVDDLLALHDPGDAGEVSTFLRDIRRVVLSSRSIIDIAPLQVYASALVFSPVRSITRELFKQEELEWITTAPAVEDNWSLCVQTLEGHSDWVRSVAFSPDSRLIASGSADKTIKIWDTATGRCTQTLEGHSDWVSSVAFSPDSRLIASGSDDKTVKIWDTATGRCTQTLNTDRRTYNISFNPIGLHIQTNSGTIDIAMPPLSTLHPAPSRTASPTLHQDYGISSDGRWIMRGSENWLWLPPEYRPVCSAIAPSTIVIGSSSGRVSVIAFGQHQCIR
ncbi:Vegetative incompatibility protein HET-E-1 [Madurella mycetomatis]|uniref:Vegetative incompatibility protein HET-E-1 n=1 Tax=Madurella mycetomatis TaxID=100816 RepID=A0A175W460_9PEZI|nr:Vegetative incompatibility protein HET-E-1 [Madurella mycetomatis]